MSECDGVRSHYVLTRFVKNLEQVKSCRMRKALLGDQLWERKTAARGVQQYAVQILLPGGVIDSDYLAWLADPDSENKQSPTMTSPLGPGLYKHKAAAIQLVHTNQPSSNLFLTSPVLLSFLSQHLSFFLLISPS